MATDLSTLTTLINDRRRETSNASVDMTTVGFRAINSTIEIWNEIHDWPWTIQKTLINYNQGVDTYALDSIVSDFKYPLTLKYYKPGGRIFEFKMTSPLRFDSAVLWGKRFAIQVIAGIQTIRIKATDGLTTLLNGATQYNQNGTWIGGSAITGIATDQYEGFLLPSSVSFSFNGTSGTITNDGNIYTTFKALDLSSYLNRSTIYFDINIPSVTNLTSLSLKWGTDSSNYYSATVTKDYLGASFIVGWNRIKIAWSSTPTTVGAPTNTLIKYLQLTVTCSGATNLGLFRIQNFFICENIPLELTYYSTNMVTTLAGVQSQVFASSAATTDTPLWTGRWDIASEPFINSVLQIIFWITGEFSDMQIAKDRIEQIVGPLKTRYPSQRRYPTLQITTDTNFEGQNGYRRYNNYNN